MSFREYPAYKNSSLKWLGHIPEHWELRRLKHLFLLVKRPVQEGDGIVTCFRDGTVTLRSKRRTEGFTNAIQEIGYQRIRAGDLVIHAMDAFAGAIGVSDSDGKSSPVYSVCVPRSHQSVQTEYYGKLLRSMALSGFVASLAKGIRERSTDFRWSDAGEIYLPVPSRGEQTQVASFLDYETAKIDALIREQERLIDLLQEKRQAVISHAVTKGLDPNVPMKDSGVQWLGKVPAHWRVRKVSYDFTAVKGPRGATLTKEYCASNTGPYPVYSGQTDNAGVLGSIEDFDFSLGSNGGLLTTTVGAKAMSLNFVTNNISLSQNCMLIRPLSRQTFIKFYFYHLQPLFQLERAMIPDHMQPSFRMEDLYKFFVAQPPLKEQEAIALALDGEMGRFDDLEKEAKLLIERLKERRSALISAAVTGKIDVRNWQPPSDESALDVDVRETGMESTA